MKTGRSFVIVALVVVVSGLAGGQDYYSSVVVHPNQQVRLNGLQLRTATGGGPTALVAALETVIGNPAVCCGENSAFPEMGALVDHRSLQDIAANLDGKHHTSAEGRPVYLFAHYLPASSAENNHIVSDEIVGALKSGQPMLMEWNSRVLIVNGAIFDEKVYSDGRRDYVIHKLLLLDPTTVDIAPRRTFDREKDDWSQVKGFLFIRAGDHAPGF